jgi:membrane associated rhomboid family serine protease
MNEASVGFQCPSCVAEGRKQTRAGLTAYGGRRPTNPNVTSISLIGLNAAVWVLIVVTGWQNSSLIDRLALIPGGRCGSEATSGGYYNLFSEQACNANTSVAGDGMWFPGVSEGAYWQLISNAFTHVQIWHIGANMLALWFLGPQLEMVLGRARFLALYLISALAGSTLVYWTEGSASATLGASGAIFGLLGALMVIAYKVNGDIRVLLPWLLINAVITFVVPNVSWQGHVGGFVAGAVIAAAMVYAPRSNRTRWQMAALVGITVLIAGAIVARTLVLA